MTWPSLEILSSWANIAVVVLGAVAGATAIVALVLSNRLGAGKDAALANFQTESMTAIATADARSAEANTKAAEAARGTADALAAAAAANERARKLELKAAAQQERAAKAERELLELRERQKPQSLSGDQRTRFLALAATIPKGPGTVRVLSTVDSEAVNFSREFEALFKDAGFTGDDRRLVRAAYRDRGAPVDRGYDFGFRVVVSPFSSDL